MGCLQIHHCREVERVKSDRRAELLRRQALDFLEERSNLLSVSAGPIRSFVERAELGIVRLTKAAVDHRFQKPTVGKATCCASFNAFMQVW